MASELRVTTIANNAGTESVESTYVINGSAKTWGNWRYTTNTYGDSFNISSGTDLGTGNYKHTLTNSMTDANYMCHVSLVNNLNQMWTNAHLSSSFGSRTYTGSADSDQHHMVSNHGDLA